MKKNLLASLIAATSIVAVNNALAADGTIDFTGEIIDQACELAAGSDALKVNLGQVSKKHCQMQEVQRLQLNLQLN